MYLKQINFYNLNKSILKKLNYTIKKIIRKKNKQRVNIWFFLNISIFELPESMQ